MSVAVCACECGVRDVIGGDIDPVLPGAAARGRRKSRILPISRL